MKKNPQDYLGKSFLNWPKDLWQEFHSGKSTAPSVKKEIILGGSVPSVNGGCVKRVRHLFSGFVKAIGAFFVSIKQRLHRKRSS